MTRRWVSRAALVLGMIALVIAPWWYLTRPAGAVREKIGRLTTFLNQAEQEKVAQVTLEQELQDFADRTLGGDVESVDHQLRRQLNRIGAQVGLTGLSVNTAGRSQRPTPARSQLTDRGERTLRAEIDFVELEGVLLGEGTLDQVMQVVHQLNAEPWLKRIDQLRLQPRDNGGVVDCTLRLTTLFLPDRWPTALPEPLPSPPGFEAYLALVDRNPFRLPPPPAPPEEPEAIEEGPMPPVEPVDELGGWVITAVVEGPQGREVWLANQASGESVRLTVGGRLEGLELATATGIWAEFLEGEECFRVAVGQKLEHRTPCRP